MSKSDENHENEFLTATSSWLQASDPRVLWDALTHDAEVGVIVVDILGTIRFANAAARDAIGDSQVDLKGKTWGDLLPKDVADERIRYAEQVAQSSQPLALIGMIKGVCRCAIFRSLETDPVDTRARAGDMPTFDGDGSGAGVEFRTGLRGGRCTI